MTGDPQMGSNASVDARIRHFGGNDNQLGRSWLFKQGGSAWQRQLYTRAVLPPAIRIVVRGTLCLFSRPTRPPGSPPGFAAIGETSHCGADNPSPTSCCRHPSLTFPAGGGGKRGVGECRWHPPGRSRRHCGGRSRSGACRLPPSRGQARFPWQGDRLWGTLLLRMPGLNHATTLGSSECRLKGPAASVHPSPGVTPWDVCRIR